MNNLSRRKFMKIGAASSLVLSGCSKTKIKEVEKEVSSYNVEVEEALTGDLTITGGKDISPTTKVERRAIPSACWQCVTRDGIIGHVEDDRITQIEGNPELPRTNGKICAKGQGGVNQVYDPDRVLFPMKQTGSRGDRNGWVRVSWDEALDEITDVLKPLYDAGEAKKVYFHYGRMKASSSKIIKSYFLPALGTGTINGHTSICEAQKWTSQEIVWGKHYDINDVLNSAFILNFGCNVLEAHTNSIPFSQRVIKALADNGTRMVTFDVRLSNTAARSSEWVPIKPGTDLAVVLAMIYVIMVEDGGVKVDSDFVENWTTTTVSELTSHMSSNAYTPEWAEGISGVSAAKIRELAKEYANNSPGSTIISYRGAVMHYNGVETERAIQTLEGLCGNIDTKGGRVHAVGASWKSSYSKPSSGSKIKIVDGFKDEAALPTHHSCHKALEMIKEKIDTKGNAIDGIEVYWQYCYTAVYANGDMQRNIDILKDTNAIPHSWNVNTSFDESAALADIILPDATYLERWDWEDMYGYDLIPEYSIRQPMIDPLGDARDFKDVCCDIANRLGGDIKKYMAFGNAETFVRDACDVTPGVKEAGGFAYMKKHGAWYDKTASPTYEAYKKETDLTLTDPTTIADDDTNKYIFKDDEGICWEATKADYNTGYRNVSKAYGKYKGQEVGGKIYKGFKPDKLNKSGLFEIKSSLLEAKGFPALPSWMEIPEHQSLGSDELIMTTFKVNVQIHSRSQNCKYLTEIFHDNPAWINSATASALGISDGDEVTVTYQDKKTSSQFQYNNPTTTSMKVKVKVTDSIVPGVIAISHHLGHWEYGRYASGNANPLADQNQAMGQPEDVDLTLKWWDTYGYRPNWIVPNASDPISGSIRFMDTVVKVAK